MPFDLYVASSCAKYSARVTGDWEYSLSASRARQHVAPRRGHAHAPTCTAMTLPPFDTWCGAVWLMIAWMYGIHAASKSDAFVRSVECVVDVAQSASPPAVVSALIYGPARTDQRTKVL